MRELSGKTAVVTGASRGIGAETARRIAAEGVRTCVHYGGSADAARAVVAEIEAAGGSAFAVQADFADAGSIEPLVAAIRDGFDGQPIDYLVNNAGIGSEWGKHGFGGVTADHFDTLFHVNVLAPILLTQALAEDLAEGGRVVLVSSVSGRSSQPRSPVYAASKAAVNSLTGTLALALAKKGVTVNAIAPGAVDTDFLEGIRKVPGFEEAAKKACWSGRLGTAEDIAGAIMMLLREESGWINGRVIEATGGLA